jgi:zinc protease
MYKVLLPMPADPTISLSVSFSVGSQNDPAGKEGLANLTAAMLAEAATRSKSYDEILAALYPLAADYDICVDRELTTLTGRVHKDKLDDYSELFTAALLQPAFKADDFERLKNDTINYLTNTLRYSSDEELAKALLYSEIFSGSCYAHPEAGTVAGVNAITIDDVRDFYATHFTQANVTLGIGGGYDPSLPEQLTMALAGLPAGKNLNAPAISTTPIAGIELTLINKPGADASVSIGFPIGVHRGERDFYALWIANSWLGEHRNAASHLFQVIRETRGLNYGNYSYIECFPDGGELQMPPVNVPRRQQIFEIWIRSLPTAQAPFALKAALRELQSLCDNGMSKANFELTRMFLTKYSTHFADTTSARLGYAVDDWHYAINNEGHLARFRRMMGELTLDDVNAAIRTHLNSTNLKVAIVTDGAPALARVLLDNAPTPIEYESEMPAAVLAEDEKIAAFPLSVSHDAVRILTLDDAFAS